LVAVEQVVQTLLVHQDQIQYFQLSHLLVAEVLVVVVLTLLLEDQAVVLKEEGLNLVVLVTPHL
jgi:hypothetical protein